MATTGSDFAQTPDAAERAALPKLKTLYVTGPAGSPTDVASQQLVALFPDLDITMVGTVAGALAEARKDRSIVALLISPQVPQNDTLALIVSLRRDRVPMAIVPVVLESHRDFFASAVSAGADDVILLRGDGTAWAELNLLQNQAKLWYLYTHEGCAGRYLRMYWQHQPPP